MHGQPLLFKIAWALLSPGQFGGVIAPKVIRYGFCQSKFSAVKQPTESVTLT